MDRPYHPALQDRGALSVDDFCAWAGISRGVFYQEAKAGRIKVRKIGRRSVVVRADADAWLSSLPFAETGKAA